MDKNKDAEQMEQKKKTLTPGIIKSKYDGGHAYKTSLGLPAKWRTNDKFVAGDQWSAVPHNQPQLRSMPRPVLNIAKQIVNFKTSSVKGESVKMVFSPFGAGSGSGDAFSDEVQDLGDLLNKLTEVTWEKAKMPIITSRVVDRAAVTGIGITYFYWDKSIGSKSKESPYIGDVRAECLDAMYVVFGNPQELDVQRQPYIVVSKRSSLESVRREAESNKMSKEDLKLLEEDVNDGDKYEGSTVENKESPKVTVYTYFWKKDGKIHYAKSTKSVMLLEDREMNLSLYPFSIFNWEERMDCVYGNDEVSAIIPNQKAINGLAAMDLMSKQLTGFPKMIIDTRYIDPKQVTNQIGEILRMKSANMPPGHIPVNYIQPAQQTNAVGGLIEMFMQKTKDFSGANEAVTGEANTNNASAIMLLQKASSLPTEDIRRRYYQYIEDCGNILVDFYKSYYTPKRLMQYKKSDGSFGEIEFESEMIKDVEFTIRSDIGASSVFSDSNAISTLDKMVQLQMIGKVEYLKLMPKSAAPFKEELLAIWKQEAEMQRAIQEEMGIDAAGNPIQKPPSIQDEMIQEMEEVPTGQRLRLEEQYGKTE